MKAYYDGSYAGGYSGNNYPFGTLSTGQDISWWGGSVYMNSFLFQGYQKNLVLIKGRALDTGEVQQVLNTTRQLDGVSSLNP